MKKTEVFLNADRTENQKAWIKYGKNTPTPNHRFAKLRGEVLALSFAVFYLIWCGLTEVLQVKPQFLKPANR
ncbi:hypothetical protein BCY91_13425 [Pelobium manganitolerans]|uniref:Uncharacterized protein n=1 Tax=Pelobium manganitolerans TaxID=1842495 RepID=A0A419SAV6_9SPHI|nr:hypothetical protein BCY91_13425 [Pelobium manganitolerans]